MKEVQDGETMNFNGVVATGSEMKESVKGILDWLEATGRGNSAPCPINRRTAAIFHKVVMIALERGSKWERVEAILRAGGPPDLAIFAAVTGMPMAVIGTMAGAMAEKDDEDEDEDEDDDLRALFGDGE
jgi:hypothetical protein